MQGTTTVSDVGLIEIGDPTSAAWREEGLTRVAELSGLESWILAHPELAEPSGEMPAAIHRHLCAARRAAVGTDLSWIARQRRALNGSSFERTLSNLDAAEVNLLRLAPSPVLFGALPSIHAHVNRYLPKDDPRRQAVERIAQHHTDSLRREYEARLRVDGPGGAGPDGAGDQERDVLGPEERDILLGAQHAANTQRRRDLIRLRTFRNLLLGGIVTFTLIGLGLGLVGSLSPTTIPLCFTPEAGGDVTLVCPRAETPLGPADSHPDIDLAIARTVTHGDVWLVELLGLLGAGLTVATSLRNLKGVSTPYSVPVTLALFKAPTGAVTAVAGLLLMRADFVPGLSALDSSAQILGWALVFGISQQLVTRFADGQAAGLVESVKGRGAGGDRPLKSEQPA